jgi:hypothetical protein
MKVLSVLGLDLVFVSFFQPLVGMKTLQVLDLFYIETL